MPHIAASALASLSASEQLRLLIKETPSIGTQAKLAEALGIDRTYVSQMATGKVNWLNSGYFPAMVKLFGLTAEEVEVIKPDAVITFEAAPAPSFDPRALFHPKGRQQQQKRDLWPNLAAMIEEKQDKHPPLRETRWQQHLNQTRFSGGQEPDAEGWFEMYQAMRRNNVEPAEWLDD